MAPTDPERALRCLASSLAAAVRPEPDVLEGKVVNVPDISSATFDPTTPNGTESLPSAYRYVENFEALDLELSLGGIVKQLRLLEDLLIWGHAPGYNEDNVGREFLNEYCHALLSGPDGPLRCAVPLGAFVLFGPGTLYREHSHVPNEVYLALTGGGEWRVGDHSWKQLNSGQTIFIPSKAMHAIRAGAEPLLTFSFWLEPGDMNEINI